MSEKRSCFVIMPFRVREEDLTNYENDRNHWSEVYSGLISPAIEAAGMTPLRDDEDVSSRLIVDGIWRKLEEADVILCDLSSHNPNVYLELGWTLRADKKYLLIKDKITGYSFDLNQLHTFEYDHRLQPTVIRRQVVDLANAISTTLKDESGGYSLVRRMALSKRIEEMPLKDEQGALLEAIYQKIEALQSGTKASRTSEGSDKPELAMIINSGQVYSSINETDALDWPNEEVRRLSGKNCWGEWMPKPGMTGRVIHKSWHPSASRLVYVLETDGHFVPISADGLQLL